MLYSVNSGWLILLDRISLNYELHGNFEQGSRFKKKKKKTGPMDLTSLVTLSYNINICLNISLNEQNVDQGSHDVP